MGRRICQTPLREQPAGAGKWRARLEKRHGEEAGRFCRNLDACAAGANLDVVPGPARRPPSTRAQPPESGTSLSEGSSSRQDVVPRGDPVSSSLGSGPLDVNAPGSSTSGSSTSDSNTSGASTSGASTSGASRPEQGPEVWLSLALQTEVPQEKREHARRGLEANQRHGDDPEYRCLLLRQLFIADFEEGRYEDALRAAEAMIDIGELADVARQDAARACQALGDLDAAIGHLRIAARACPPSRRPFHDWTLGSLSYLSQDWEAAVAALSRAARWATTQKPLYEAQLGLALRAAGRAHPDLSKLRDALEQSPCAAGYGELVLGELCHHVGDGAAARRYLEAFAARIEGGRRARAATLQAELAHARALLGELEAAS